MGRDNKPQEAMMHHFYMAEQLYEEHASHLDEFNRQAWMLQANVSEDRKNRINPGLFTRLMGHIQRPVGQHVSESMSQLTRTSAK